MIWPTGVGALAAHNAAVATVAAPAVTAPAIFVDRQVAAIGERHCLLLRE